MQPEWIHRSSSTSSSEARIQVHMGSSVTPGDLGKVMAHAENRQDEFETMAKVWHSSPEYSIRSGETYIHSSAVQPSCWKMRHIVETFGSGE